jgi:hypothetical protein
LLKNPTALASLFNRGFNTKGIISNELGWNPADQFYPLSEWGLPYDKEKDKKNLWIPKGIVIPTLVNDIVIKLKVRRSDWHKEDSFPKYVEITGSKQSPSTYGNLSTQVTIIVESELDAMLIQQCASDLCCCMAIGGAGKKPDSESHDILKQSKYMLFSLDFDDAGKSAYQFWKTNYSNLHPWPISRGKSPGDAIKLGVNLRSWIMHGLSHINTQFKEEI